MKKKAISFVSISGILTIIGLMFAAQQVFVIQNIVCRINNQSCPDEVMQKLLYLKGKSLFFTDIHSETTSLLSDESLQIENLKKELPMTLLLDLTSVSKKYQIPLSDNQWVIYDHTGQSIFSPESDDIPTIEIDFTQNSELAASFNVQLVTLVDALHEFKIKYDTIKQPSSDHVEIFLGQGMLAFVPLENVTQKIAQLKIVLDALESNTIDQSVSNIDLRFKHPVLK